MKKTFTGFCPTLNKEHIITVDYLDASTLTKKEYIKGLAECSVAAFGKCPIVAECPLIAKAPAKL